MSKNMSKKLPKNIYFFKNQKRPWCFRKMVNGKIIDRRFATRADALSFARHALAEIAQHGIRTVVFPMEDRKLLEDLRQIAGDADLREIVRWWKAHFRGVEREGVSVEQAFAEFVEWLEKSGRSAGYIHNVRITQRRFCATFGREPVCALDKTRIVEWLLGIDLAPKTIKNFRGDVCGFLAWCKNAKDYIAEIPVIDARLLPVVHAADVGVMSARDARAFLNYLQNRAPKFIPHYALRLFAGLRRSEAQKMRWEWIDCARRRIRVPAFFNGERICKTGDTWLLLPGLIPDTIYAWLKPFARKSGAIPFPGRKAERRAVVQCKIPRNGLRHTFATMYLAWTRDEGKTTLATRHTNVATFRAHYRGVNQTKEEAALFWSLRPNQKKTDRK